MPFNPIDRAREAEKLVMQENRRRYHRFRAAPYYGGIATADAVGCPFLCAYCWNYERNLRPERHGKFYSPKEVADNLISIARKKGYHLYRITGSEPILGEVSLSHFIEVKKLVSVADHTARFILETNGLMLGYHPEFIERLDPQGLMVRVAIKGVDEESFELITEAQRSFFEYPLKAVKLLQDRGIEVWPALMGDLFDDKEILKLKDRLKRIGITSDLEIEYLERYPFVMEHLKRRGVIVKREPAQ
jgi:uncharacterized Fe-S cluster-containing radical SAM superfamily protein